MLLIDDGNRVFRAPQVQPKVDNTQTFQGAVNGAQAGANANPANRNGGVNGTNQTSGASNPATNTQSYNPAPPPVTVDNDITRKLNPVLGPAQQAADDAQARVNANQKQLTALYDDMDQRGASVGKLARAKKLEEQQAADQKAFDAANAKVSALKTGTYSQQLKADQDKAGGSKKAADQAFTDLNKQLPPSTGFKQGDELTDQQLAKLTPDQRTAYFRYVQAQSQAVNDQDKVNATTLELNRNYTQWQVYASDPGKYGDIADKGLKAVNDALRPLNLEMGGPEKIDPRTAAHNLAEINQIAPYYFSALDTSTAAVAAMHDVLGAQVNLADKQAALAKWQRANPNLMAPGNSYELAVNKARQDLIAAQQKAQPLMLDYGVKAAYTGKLATQLELQQAQTEQQTAQTNYAQWRAKYPNMAAPGNPLEMALNEANRKLALVQQRASTADLAWQAASAQKDAYGLEQDARRIWVQANGDAICIGSTAQNVTPAYTAAVDKAKAARTNADRLTLQAQKSGLELQKLLAEEDVRHKQAAVSAAQPVSNGSDMVLVSYDTNAAGQPQAGGAILAQARANLQQSQTQLANVEYQQKMAQYDIERYDFIAGLPENLKNPQTEDDKAELQKKLGEFEEAHFAFLRENQFKYGPIDDQEALKQVRQDYEAERNKIDSRGWMQSGADWVTEHTGGDRSELETFLGDSEKKLEQLVAQKGTMSESDYQAKLHGIMDQYGADFVRMTLGERETDGRWHTVNEVSRFATATVVGIAATVAGGGVNVFAGAAAAFAVYEAWDIGDDVTAAAHGGDMMADGHLSISGFTALAIGNATGTTDQDMGDAARMAGQDVVMNTVSSLATGIGGGAGRLTAVAAGKWLTPVVARGLPALSVRGASLTTDMLSTSAGHTVSQAVLGTGQEVNTGVDLAFRGKLFTAEGGEALTDQAKSQAVYLAAAPVVGFFSGGMPKAALGRQATFDMGANFAQEEARTRLTEGRDINDNEAIAALIGTVPGTAMNLVARRGAQPVDTQPAPGTDLVLGNHPAPGSNLALAGQPAPGTGLAPVARYVAHVDADGAPSLGLLGPDGRTTANVDAPWLGEHPLQVEVVETSIGADGKPQADAAHLLTRNADGSYSGTRTDADGSVTTYTTGGAGAGHPLAGIQLRNTSLFSNGAAADPGGAVTAGRTQAGAVSQPGTGVDPVSNSGQPGANGQPALQTGVSPANTGVVAITSTGGAQPQGSGGANAGTSGTDAGATASVAGSPAPGAITFQPIVFPGEASGSSETGFTVRDNRRTATGDITQARDDLFFTRTRTALRDTFGAWMPENAQPATRSIVRLGDDDFAVTYGRISGKPASNAPDDGFYDPANRIIYMRENGTGFLDPVNRQTLGHEMLHDAASPEFNRMAFGLVDPETGVTFGEAATEYLNFKANGPATYRDLPGGFQRFVDDATARNDGAAIPENWRNVADAERIFEQMGDEGRATFFQADETGMPAMHARAVEAGYRPVEGGSEPRVMEAFWNRRTRSKPLPGTPPVPGAGSGPLARLGNSRVGMQAKAALAIANQLRLSGAKFAGRVIHKGVPYIAVILPVADAVAHPWMGTRMREDIGAGNFFGRGPVLVLIAVKAAQKKMSAVTKWGATLRAAAGSSFAMNAIGNGVKFGESLSHGLTWSVASQGFFTLAQTSLGIRSLYGSYQGRKYARWSGVWDGNPAQTEMTGTRGMSWRKAARTTGVPSKMLKQANLPTGSFGFVGSNGKDVFVSVPAGASPRQLNRWFRNIANRHGVSPSTVREAAGLHKNIEKGQIKVPQYIWERDSSASRWLQVLGAGSMSAASGTLIAVDAPIWGPFDMGYVPADILISTGTGGTALMTAIPNKKAGTLAKRFPKTLAAFQVTSASALGWKGLGHLVGRSGVLDGIDPTIKTRDMTQIGLPPTP